MSSEFITVRKLDIKIEISAQDFESVNALVWRHDIYTPSINDQPAEQIVTVLASKHRQTLDSFLLGLQGLRDTVIHLDGNPYNFCRDNLKYTQAANTWATAATETLLLLKGAHAIRTDTAINAEIRPYTWSVKRKKGRQVVIGVKTENGIRKQVELARYVLGNVAANQIVVFLNADPFDCRRENLDTRVTHDAFQDFRSHDKQALNRVIATKHHRYNK